MSRFTIRLLALFIAWGVASAQAQEAMFDPGDIGKPGSRVGMGMRSLGPAKTDEESRSLIVQADGYAYLGDDVTLRQARLTALAEAKRLALQSAHTYIDSSTTVENGMLSSDRIEAKTRGSVRVLEQKDHGLQDGRYHIWIKAEVRYDLTPPKGQEVKALTSASAPLTVRAWTDQKHYTAGQSVTIHLWGNRDFYARVVDVMADGSIVQLAPNRYRSETLFKGGVTHTLPDPQQGDRFQLTVSPPFGEDRIVVYASSNPLGAAATREIGMGLGQYAGDRASLANVTRGLTLTPTGGAQGSTAGVAEFHEAEWRFTTTP
ncbi:DUF4384 domain-containing protein [Magnetofaba australis]|uniref:DUF4384 domain-containing protein n=1 Tax=Magnetofaba australis IT-1 TaxID=1434232 RepID=A0A1Y2K0T1_9PROT|nr:DUF4384 domain-containing protein [Magnetofaba australis]OSM01582.1 hypothetical protein MAIT1_01581 [Magnetofaba australis IT-1]